MPTKIEHVIPADAESNSPNAPHPEFEPPKVTEFAALAEVTLQVISAGPLDLD